ncbi:MAG: discoidin domain-containing protein, partial [Longicatena sp.]|nr:discoidin domain-containing protein [Longicatena sp.]
SGNFYELRVFGSSENKLEELLTQAKEIIMNTEENDTNKAYLQQLARSVDLIENVLETSEEITIALNGLEKELAKEPYNTSTYKDELKVQLENKLSDAEDYSYYYKKAISVYLDSNATQAEVDAIIAQLNEVITNLNLALYKDVITSVGDGSKVTDGIISGQNFWDGDKYPSSFVIDLGKEYFLNEIKVHPLYRDTEARAYQYEVYVSCDNESFDKVAEKKNDELEVAAGTSYFFEDEIKARYIKVIMTKNNVNAYVHMSEVEAYGRLAVESDKSQLQQAIQDAQAIDTSIYTESSVEELSNALNNAIMVNDKVNASQKEVDEAYTTLLAAMNALQEKPMEVENVVTSIVNYKTIELSWDAVQDAQSYIVERLTSEGEWLELVQTSETTYVATGVKTGKEYTYRVKAVNAEEVSEGVEVKATATLQCEVELTITPNGANQFDLSWTSVEGATRYIIYRKDGEGAWKKVLTLGKDATSYTSKAMKANTYQYQVKAARYDSVDRVMTNGSNVVAGIVGLETMVPTNVKAEVEGTTVTLSWDKVVGMAYYEIYRSKDGGAYRQIKRTTDTTLTSSGLKAGSIYQYKIRAFALLNGEKVYAPEVVTEAIVIE